MPITDGWFPEGMDEDSMEGDFGAYQFPWGVASLDYINRQWFHIIVFSNEMEHMLDYYPMGTVFHVHPEGFRIDTPTVKQFDPVALDTLLQ